jgi:transcriptional regulator with XRE-family HTH domain
MTIVPEQCRAARAILNWSQDELEEASNVAKKTIADFERGASLPYGRTLQELQNALEVGGVIFIPENGGGAGVRRRTSIPRLTRRKISRFDRQATFVMSYRSSEYRVNLSTDILDDLDRKNYESDKAFEGAFDVHLNKILLIAASAIDVGRSSLEGVLTLKREDFKF